MSTKTVGAAAALLFGVGAGVFYGASAFMDRTPSTTRQLVTQVPTTARVACTKQGTDVLTPEVRPRSDGIHVLIDNHTDNRAFYLRDAASGAINHGGRLVPEAVADVRTTFPPRDILVGCFRSHRDAPFSEIEGQGFGTLSVVDPEGLWVSPELDCSDTRNMPLVPASEASDQGSPDFETMARQHITAIERDDALAHAGYPETEFHAAETLMWIRDGESIGILSFFKGQAGWRIGVRACRR